jgi:hypothetical protein
VLQPPLVSPAAPTCIGHLLGLILCITSLRSKRLFPFSRTTRGLALLHHVLLLRASYRCVKGSMSHRHVPSPPPPPPLGGNLTVDQLFSARSALVWSPASNVSAPRSSPTPSASPTTTGQCHHWRFPIVEHATVGNHTPVSFSTPMHPKLSPCSSFSL